jgi:hypothetical protein
MDAVGVVVEDNLVVDFAIAGRKMEVLDLRRSVES